MEMKKIPRKQIANSAKSHVDFFSIGTNDLTQYVLATDRNNKNVSEYYKTHHPSVLSMIKKVCTRGAESNKHICLCGEIASDKQFIPLLVGLGVRSISVSYSLIPDLKNYLKTQNIPVRCL